MRHRVAHRKLGRVTEHRISLLRNQAQALLRHERIQTTVPKARELRPFVERSITIAKRGLAAGQAPADAARAPSRRPRHRRRDHRHEAVRDDRAALRGAAGRLHTAAEGRAAARRQRRRRADRARRQRVQPEPRDRERRSSRGQAPASAAASARRPAASGAMPRATAAAADSDAPKKTRTPRKKKDSEVARPRLQPGPTARSATSSTPVSPLDPARSALAWATIFACRCDGTSS